MQASEESTPDKPPIVYRDGFGNIIENEDLKLREMLSFNLLRKIFRHISFQSKGRGGEVVYHDARKEIRFCMEFGGNDVVFYLHVPKVAEWEAATGFPLDERDDILRFVAEGTQKAQAPSCFYQINENEIVFKKKGG